MGKTYTNRKAVKYNQRQNRGDRRNAKRAFLQERRDGGR